MIHIQTRLNPPENDQSRSGRKYSYPLIWHAISLASKIGIMKASKATGMHYKRLCRLCLAEQRLHQTVPEALAAFDWYVCSYNPHVTAEYRREFAANLKTDLLLKIEVCREAYRIAERTGTSFWKSMNKVAASRGLKGKSVAELVREGRIPQHWFNT
jgi:hypothetical protein